MMSRKMIILISMVMCLSVFTGISRATDEDLFITVTTPDALIVIDLSGSMAQSPSGDSSDYYAKNNCTTDWHDDDADGRQRCRKIDIAKYALFTLLNDSNTDGLNQINSADPSSLGIRLGLMRFYGCDSASESNKAYNDPEGCIKMSWPITSDAQTTPTPYASIFCNNATCNTPSRTSTNTCTVTSPAKECLVGYGTSGGTPVGNSLREAKSYLDAHKALDDSRTCRQKSVILVTDGADTYSCSGDGSSTGINQRRAPVYYAKKLAEAGYKVYVVGFGTTMSATDKRVLNWTAYFGGTRNPSATQSGDTTKVTTGTNPCNSGVDPGSWALDGYAFMASSPDELATALKSAITSIQEANYSFSSQASVAAARVQQENFLYEASFEPKNTAGSNKEPFWTGHLKKYELNSVGELITPACWDAGAKMRAQTSRNMWTYKGASDKALVSFTTANITDADLGISTPTTVCNQNAACIVGFYRGDATYNLENWKLGDIFHSNP
ncbi:MAG: VWA domain-containing protein, partial [Chloroflexi bacterium]|nr:VWA domain-containing protein [Chloroflexota bacterium]